MNWFTHSSSQFGYWVQSDESTQKSSNTVWIFFNITTGGENAYQKYLSKYFEHEHDASSAVELLSK